MESEIENLTNELIGWGRSSLTIDRYRWLCEWYLREVGDEAFTRQGVTKFLAMLKDKPGNYRRWCYSVIRRLFETNSQEWPFGKGVPEKTPPREMNAPAMPPEDVVILIESSREKLEPWETGVIALSTAYGLRIGEIMAVRPEDVADSTIFIRTKKKGDQRDMILPAECREYIKAWAGLEERPANTTMFPAFHRMARVCRVPTESGMGYHSVRRALITGLQMSGVPEFLIMRFLRWRMSASQFGMLPTYSKIPDEVVDKFVFSLHPFLPHFDVDTSVYGEDPAVKGLLDQLKRR